MIEQPINEHTFLTIAMRFYDNPQCLSVKEFEEDLRKFFYLKKLFNRYTETGELKERLIINHLVVLHNLFGVATTELLFYKIEEKHWNILATFLEYLNRMPDQIPDFNINKSDMILDSFILDQCNKN